MPRIPSITPEMEPFLQECMLKGFSSATITELVNQKFQLDLCESTIYKTIRRMRQARQEITKNILTEYLQSSATEDMKIMANIINKLSSKFDEAMSNNDTNLALKVSAELNKWSERRIALSGINNTLANQGSEQLEFDDVADEIQDIINKELNIN